MATPARWTEDDIRASRTETAGAASLPQRPRWNADPMNLLVVVEAGDDHVSLVDGERFERIHRFASRAALHDEPKFSPDGRYAYLASRNGWVTRYDLWNLTVVAEVRAGLYLSNIALSSDGRWVMAANQQPHAVVLFDAQLNLVKTWTAAARDGKATSRVAAVADAAPRQSFVVALQDVAELWEISYDPKAEDIYEGLVHDFRMGEGLPVRGFHNVRRSFLDEPLENFTLDPEAIHAIGSLRARDGGAAGLQVINLDVRRRIATLPVAGRVQADAAATWESNGSHMLALPNRQEGAIEVIDMKSWKHLATIATPGPGRFLRSHGSSRHLLADSMLSGSARDTLTLIDRTSLAPVARVKEEGRTLAQVEFSRDGRHALVSVAEVDGALIVYDTVTLREVKRLPMNRPAGTYNVGNRIARPQRAVRCAIRQFRYRVVNLS